MRVIDKSLQNDTNYVSNYVNVCQIIEIAFNVLLYNYIWRKKKNRIAVYIFDMNNLKNFIIS